MKRHIQYFMTAASALLLLGSCSDRFTEEAGAGMSSVDFMLTSEELAPDVKSSYTWGESEINTVQIVIADASGNVVGDLYTDSGSSLSFTGISGVTYYAWAAVNLGSRVSVSTLSDFNSGNLPVSVSAIGTNGIPMYSDGGVEFTLGSASSVEIEVTRMLARIDFKVVDSGLAGDFTVKSVKIHNGTSSYVPFASSAKETGSSAIAGFDTATSSDISSLNGGSAITLYAFENMQGNLLSGNTDPWAKVPGSITASKDKCTYLEMTASYSYQGLSSDNIIYRMYLGGNATTNFDLARNTKYTVTLYPSEEEIDGHRGSWKVENSGWTDSRSLAFDPHSVVMESLETKSVSIIKSPSDLEYVFSYDAADAAAAGLTITRTGDSVSIVSTEELDTQKTVTLHVETLDGVKYDDCVVTVKPVASDPVITYELDVTPATTTLNEGGSVSLKAIYYTITDGVKDSGTDVTSSATWSITSGSAYIKSTTTKGKYSWKDGAGTAKVRATYNGYSDNATINTNAHVPVITYVLEVTPATSTVEIGGTQQFTAMEYEYADGVYTGRSWNLTNSCLWSSSKTSIGTVGNSSSNKGFATGVSEGTTTITASFPQDGVSDSATLIVEDSTPEPVITHELVVTPATQTIAEGESAYLTATYYTYTDGVSDGGVDVTSSATWSITSGSAYISSTSTKGKYDWKDGAGTATVKATYSGYSDTAEIKTEAHVPVITYELVVTPETQTIGSGETAVCTATYYTITDGVRDSGTDVTSSATWTIPMGSTYITNSGGGRFAWKSGAGTAVVQAKYNGKSDSAEVKTEAPAGPVITYELELVSQGGGQSGTSTLGIVYESLGRFKAMYYTVTNGVRDSGVDVSSSASWSVTSGSSYVTNNGGGGFSYANGSGTAGVKATYNGLTATGTIKTYKVTSLTIIGRSSSTDPKVIYGSNKKYSVKLRINYDDGSNVTYVSFMGFAIDVDLEDTYHVSQASPASGYSFGFVANGPLSSNNTGTTSVTFSYGGCSCSDSISYQCY